MLHAKSSEIKQKVQESGLHLLSKILTYNFKFTMARVCFAAIISGCFLWLASNITATPHTIPVSVYLKVMLIFIVISETNVLFDKVAERHFPIPEKIKQHILIHFAISTTLGGLAIAYFSHLNIIDNLLEQRIVWLLITLGLIFVIGVILFSIGIGITQKWIAVTKEVEQLKQAKLKNEYSSLQDQLNPHFLFNNLSVLKSMISYDPQGAAIFVQNFTDIYRYVLQNSQKDTVKLAEEVEFANSYVGLQKERLGEGIRVDINIDPNLMQRELPPLSLQLLLENAIKHNVASKKMPLHIDIFSHNDCITVRNNLQKKETTYSTLNGLKNLISRYAILSSKQVIIDPNADFFSVTLPLI